MENALLVGLSRQVALAREIDVIANNVANVSTTGFKARQSRFAEHLMPAARFDHFQKPDQRVSYVIDQGTALDLSAGGLERTGNPLDVAMRGEGWFVINTPRGERYTRDGHFSVNARGELVNDVGQTVAGEGGPITFSPNESGISISPDGTVSSSGGVRGKLRMVRFANQAGLRHEGDNLFSSPNQPLPGDQTMRVEPGSLERSNVKPVLAMSRLVEVSRSYTTVAGIVSKLDELRRSAIQRLADIPT